MTPRRVVPLCAVAITAAAIGATGSGARDQSSAIRRDTLRFGPFGPIVLYRPAHPPTSVAIFISGDGGWNLGVAEMAVELARQNSLVAGVDIRTYLRSLERSTDPCSYPAGDLENLSQYVQRRTQLPQYLPPVLVGYSSGATLVYAALAQAPPTTFAGALSLGFCPDLPIRKPFCRGSGLAASAVRGHDQAGYRFAPVVDRRLSWIALHGEVDQVCNVDSTRAFLAQVPGADVVSLPEVGHGFGVTRRWLPQFLEAFQGLQQSATPPPLPPAEVADLPLIEVPAGTPGDDRLAIVISGDGGWASLDREVGDALATRGIPVVGWNSLQYFWTARTPGGAAADLTRVARHYLPAWRKARLVLVGYSRGAEVLPFMVARLPQELKRAVAAVVLIAPARTANFTFHAADLLLAVGRRDDLPIKPEIEKLAGLNVLCLFGSDEAQSACRDLDPALVRAIELPGGHHLGGRYEALAALILKEGLQKAKR